MTSAGVLTPPAAPADAVSRAPAGARLGWLHLRTRRVPAGLLALAVCAGLLRAALSWHWTFSTGRYAQQVPMIMEAGAAAVIAVTTHSPLGETERATGSGCPTCASAPQRRCARRQSGCCSSVSPGRA